MLYEMLNQPDRFLDSVRRYTFSLTTSMAYGFRTVSFDDPRQAQLFQLVETLAELVQSNAAALLEVFPVLRRLPEILLSIQKFAREQHKREMDLFMSLWLNVKQGMKDGTAKPCFCVEQIKTQEKEGFSDELAAYNAGSVLEAGADVRMPKVCEALRRCDILADAFDVCNQTTSNTLYGWIQAMVLFPEVQKRAQGHIDQIVGAERLPEMEDYPQLPYIRSCIKEATRWMPTAILGFPHAVMEEDEYLGYRIPKGAGIINNVYSIHMDPNRHPEPRQFNPDRYMDDTQSLVDAATNPDPARRATFAFGAGRRICQGMHVAERSLFLAMARILWAFDIVPAKDEKGNDILPDPSKLTQGFICMPEPFQATIKPRSARRAELIRKSWEDAQKKLDPSSGQWR